MSHLSELLHRERGRLYEYVDQVTGTLSQVAKTSEVRKIYTIKSRVKDYSEVHRKLVRLGGDAQKLINDPHIDLPQLMEYVRDLIGFRVVCLFSDDVTRLANTIKNRRGSMRYFALCVDPSTRRPEIDWYKYDERVRDYERNIKLTDATRRESGYTSIHLICQLTDKHPLHSIYTGFASEIQIRTVLEEAWGETSHYLAYKKSASEEMTAQLLKISGNITLLNDELLATCRGSEQSEMASRYRYTIQTSRDYHFNPSADVGSHVGDKLIEATRLRDGRRHRDARNEHSSFINREILSLVPKKIRKQFGNVLRCELALDDLYLSTPTSLEKATSLYARVLISDCQHFWANFRMSYIMYRKGRLVEAIEYAQCAEQAFVKQENGLRKWWDTTGLQGDVLAWQSVCRWRLAQVLYEEAYRVPQSPIEGHLRLAFEEHQIAIAACHRALESLGKSRIKSSVKDQVLRCRNNLLYYYTQLGKFDIAGQYQCKQSEMALNPLLMHSMAWFEFKRPGGNIRAAMDRMQAAISMLSPIKSEAQASKGLIQEVYKHYKILNDCIENEETYQANEEYWKWS